MRTNLASEVFALCPPPLGPLWCSDPKPRLARTRLTPSRHTSTSAHASHGVRDLRVFYSKRKAAATVIVPNIAQGGALLGGRGSAMAFGATHAEYLSARGSAGERAGACLQGRHPGASAPARLHIRTRLASRKGIDSNLFHGLMFLICVYFILPQHSARQRQPETFNKPPGGARSWWGRGSNAIWGSACSLFVS